MDLNLVVLCGRLATTPEIKTFDSGARLARLLITTRTEVPKRRVDVVPVTVWEDLDNPSFDFDEIEGFELGDRIWVAGSTQRRFWSDTNERRSRIEVVANHVQKRFADVAVAS